MASQRSAGALGETPSQAPPVSRVGYGFRRDSWIFTPNTSGEFTPLMGNSQPVNFRDVLKDERKYMEAKKRTTILGGGKPGAPFSVAFSGGGIRAAAFQSGVLWRLAEAGLLKDVEYLAAVSGGGYIASSFASHCLAEPKAFLGEKIDAWYLRVVSKSICRMQRNAGGFVRDWQSDGDGPFSMPTDGSGILPRAFDVPLLLLCLAVTLCSNPIQALFVFLVPVTEIVQLFFSAAMRGIFCAPDNVSHWYILMTWSPMIYLIRILEGAMLVNLVIWIAWKMPCFGLKDSKVAGEPRSMRYLMVRGSLACLVRFSCLLVMLIFLIICIPNLEMWMHSRLHLSSANVGPSRQDICRAYMTSGGIGLGGHKQDMGCANFYNGAPWYKDALFQDFATSQDQEQTAGNTSVIYGSGRLAPDEAAVMGMQKKVLQNRQSILSIFFSVVAVMLVVSAFLMPIEPQIFMNVLTLIGPMFVVVLVMILIQYRVFGPLTRQTLVYGWMPFDHWSWNAFVGFALLTNVAMVPFFNTCKRVWHWYYLRSLKGNFLAHGADVPMADLKQESLACPLLVLTGTVNDFVPNGTTVPISEIFFSPLHTGGKSTGYLNTPKYRTLAKCTALTGAGCLDAISLSMSAQIRFRVWLELLNLSWGDYILFQKDDPLMRHLQKVMVDLSPWLLRTVSWLRLRVPTMAVTFLFVALLAVGWMRATLTQNEDCVDAKATVWVAVVVVTLSFVASFFGFVPGLDCLAFSPLVREMHQLTGFQFQGNHPPGLLYVTDGGVQDCTCLVQLMRRRCGRILLALAASDPDDELAVLRSAMDIAAKEKLGCFFDPEDPRRDVRILLEEYKADKEMPFLHIGIRYGWTEGSVGEQDWEEPVIMLGESDVGPSFTHGELFVVKNRLPPSFERTHMAKMQPLLTEEEIQGGSSSSSRSCSKMHLLKPRGSHCIVFRVTPVDGAANGVDQVRQLDVVGSLALRWHVPDGPSGCTMGHQVHLRPVGSSALGLRVVDIPRQVRVEQPFKLEVEVANRTASPVEPHLVFDPRLMGHVRVHGATQRPVGRIEPQKSVSVLLELLAAVPGMHGLQGISVVDDLSKVRGDFGVLCDIVAF
mmetsp:Transcript_45726/g.120842  ORF Transcript_45726/g.120842 Transcript_45726/m.120842 type:complete len:1100 (-) Transcript_45726:49-3348(-)